MCLFRAIPGIPGNWNSSVKSVSSWTPDVKEPGSWFLFWPTRTHKPGDKPLPPVRLEGIPTPFAGTDHTIRPRRRGVLENVWNRLSRGVGLTTSRPYPIPQLQVFIEVRNETFYDSERGLASWAGSADPTRLMKIATTTNLGDVVSMCHLEEMLLRASLTDFGWDPPRVSRSCLLIERDLQLASMVIMLLQFSLSRVTMRGDSMPFTQTTSTSQTSSRKKETGKKDERFLRK
ncbi:hypothetical protein BDM02DRAFT_3129333 [Thelephora ganbajun]|uniref:Uncharacterized protein n=1 Tax=Thelephora ganbajun TaxID=370292 RepID=A0ACB6ZEK8_THEGA|nr:hypothetical protein BDM02DRAFT_3129333 [Thelephora ganbajun]